MNDPIPRLVVNADDLGMSPGVNEGIAEAHRRGIVTSASLMVRRPAAAAGAEMAAGLTSMSVGLHLEVASESGVAECRSQLTAFRRLIGRDPSHIDSHHHVHRSGPVASAAGAIAAELGIPLRAGRIRFEGGFYGRRGGRPSPENVSVGRLIEIIEALPGGWTELGCHPGIGVEAESSYGPERELELRTLCDPAVRAAIAARGVELRSFTDLS
jgi:predicted glycoside hydrolase/deacetylase ChbG (UPF0249 family)